MNKQLMIIGFHRSGTSMLSQELHDAGLFLGKRLLGSNYSNADGHFEDYDFFNFHEKVLQSQNETWKYHSNKKLYIDEKFYPDMDNIIQSRDKSYEEWGFKDPRTCLFLPYWQEKLVNPYGVVIYRHYEECVNSLLERSSREIAHNKSSDISFFQDPSLAYKMWLVYNKNILEHIEKYPNTTIVISHSAVIAGFPIIDAINKKFNFNLNSNKTTKIKKELLSIKEFSSYHIDESLKKELDDIWNALEKLSISPSSEKIKEISSNKKYSIKDFEDILNSLSINTKNNNILQNIIQEINNRDSTLEEKLILIRKNQQLFISFNKTKLLIESLLKLVDIYPYSHDLYLIISNLYLKQKEYHLSEFYLLKIFTVAKQIFPYFYNNLANFYIQTNNLLLADNAIEKAIKGNANNPAFYMTLALLNSKNNDYINAIQNIDKAISLLNNNKNADINFHLRKIAILQDLNEDGTVNKLFDELLEKYPNEERIILRQIQIENEINHKPLDKIKEQEKILPRLQNDNYFFEKINSLLSTIKEPWAKENLHNRVTNHLKILSKEGTLPTYQISFVVDDLALHYYQAELLLYSLEKFGKVKKENILVQCLNRVNDEFINFLKENNYIYHIIEPYLDGKYCNKLQQLEVFKNTSFLNISGVILLDTDMFVLEPFKMPNDNIFCAKVVDAPNPKLDTLKGIFTEAKLNFPKTINSDWNIEDNEVFASNFNGGFYYIPKKYISSVSREWRKWGSWLYDRSYLFATPQQAIHTDQVSMSMAIESLNLSYYNLGANYNCPIHVDKQLMSLDINIPIKLIHYHREISQFGLLKSDNISNLHINKSIIKANKAISEIKDKFSKIH